MDTNPNFRSSRQGVERLRDRHDNSVSTRHRKALDLYDHAAASLLAYSGDPLATIEAALAEDPSFVMGHSFKAGLLATTTESGAEPAIAAALDAATLHAASATTRERQHIEAARAWLHRDLGDAVRRYGDIVAEHPRDLFALQIAHLGDFFLGQSSMLRDRPAQVLHAWTAEDAAYSYVLGMHAFGLEECGAYAEAEKAGRDAVERDAANAWAVHAVAHVCEMQGRIEDGSHWLEDTSAGWNKDNFFAFHNWWHLALFHLDTDNHAAALDLYDTRIRPLQNPIALEMIDASALLWRLHLRGAEVGQRWSVLADCWAKLGEAGYYAFNDVHALMAFLMSGRADAADAVMRALEAAVVGPGTNGMMSWEVGLPLARALSAFARGAYAVSIEELSAVRGIANRFGGSHAQRDLIHLTLCEAAMRAGRRNLATALVSERLALKPHSGLNRRLLNRAGGEAHPLPKSQAA